MSAIPRRRARTPAAFAALVAALAAGCASSAPPYPVLPVREITLEWRPTPGMRLVHRVSMALEASGPLTRPLSDQQRKPHGSVTRVTEVAAVGPDYFDLRFAQDGVVVPATVRFSRDWAILETRLDDAVALRPREREALEAKVRQLSLPFAQSGQMFRHWTLGDSRPFDIPLSGFPGAMGSGQGTIALRRVVLLDNREALEFEWRADAEFAFTGEPGRGVPGRIEISGREWRDVATGASLRVVADANASFTRQGERTRVTYRSEEVLDLASSRL